jgi:hypothetical protein
MLVPTRLSLAALLFAPAAIIITQQAAVAQSATQVANTAKQITVLIEGQNPGSGVIISTRRQYLHRADRPACRRHPR